MRMSGEQTYYPAERGHCHGGNHHDEGVHLFCHLVPEVIYSHIDEPWAPNILLPCEEGEDLKIPESPDWRKEI
ncbi:hypothetical protein AOLI_G00307640 [Acnodon oligacanthus]